MLVEDHRHHGAPADERQRKLREARALQPPEHAHALVNGEALEHAHPDEEEHRRDAHDEEREAKAEANGLARVADERVDRADVGVESAAVDLAVLREHRFGDRSEDDPIPAREGDAVRKGAEDGERGGGHFNKNLAAQVRSARRTAKLISQRGA